MRKPEKPDCLASYTRAILRLYRDVAALCSISASSQDRDIETLSKRTSTEGLSFLTKTLPMLGKCLDKALSSDEPFETGSSFVLSKKAPFTPVFLGGFWKLIFGEDGRVGNFQYEFDDGPAWDRSHNYDWRSTTDRAYADMHLRVQAVRAVRQVCYLFYKLEGAHSKDSELEVINRFIATDASLPARQADLCLTATTALALESAQALVHRVLCGLDLHDIIPGHGPGAVATREKPWEKMFFSRYYESLDEVYPYSDYFFFNYTHLVDHLEDLEGLTTLQHGVAKVALVPKDSRGPRLISMEPLELQWIQQGQMRSLLHCIETHPCTSGFVNFTNQEVNRSLALQNSFHGEYITVDMKDASDRVSCWLVDKLFPEHIKRCLYASRSKETILPTGEHVMLQKFAPMGSSVCFPIEALTFWAIAVGALKYVRGPADFYSLPEVYVYGDDIIIRKEDFAVIRHVFEELHLRFNEDKCCTGRFFRESCGLDAFALNDVSPIRIKASAEHMSPPALLAYVSYVNSARARGYESFANELQSLVTQMFGSVPISNAPGNVMLSYWRSDWNNEEVETYLSNTFKRRFNAALQRVEVKVPVPTPPFITTGEPGWSELLRMKRLGSSEDPFGFKHEAPAPCRHTIPGRLSIRWAWTPIREFMLA